MFRNPTADLVVVLAIVLLIFGPKRLPTLGRQLGQGIREFKDGITGHSNDDEAAERPEISSASATATSAAAPTGATPDRESAEVASDRRS